MSKQQKTNAMRILEQKALPHRLNFYDCDEFTDAVQIVNMILNQGNQVRNIQILDLDPE